MVQRQAVNRLTLFPYFKINLVLIYYCLRLEAVALSVNTVENKPRWIQHVNTFI